MNRRKFLLGTAGLFCAPAIVRSESLMKIWTPPGVLTYEDLIKARDLMDAERIINPPLITIDNQFVQTMQDSLVFGTSVMYVSGNKYKLLEPYDLSTAVYDPNFKSVEN